MSAEPFHDATYHDDYSEDEEETPAAKPQNDGDMDEMVEDPDSDDSDEDEDDFLPTTRVPIPAANPPQKLVGRAQPPPTTTANTHPVPPRPPPQQLGLIEPSILNVEPIDEFMREVSDWILRVAAGRENIEIEAKLGVLVDSRTGLRLNLPILSETILSPDYPDVRFESNMTLQQHHHFNTLLNDLVSKAAATPNSNRAKLHYAHTKLVDSFHPGPQKIRVTTDEKTGAVRECVTKTRLADLNIYSPKRKVDWRISINVETPANPPSGPPSHTRRKDRITYTHQALQIDLTQVTSSASPSSNPNLPPQPSQVLHELEVEFRDARELLRLATMREKIVAPGELHYDELVRVFINNVHILVRTAL